MWEEIDKINLILIIYISNYFFFLHVVKCEKCTEKYHVRLEWTLPQTAGELLKLRVDLLPHLGDYSGEVGLVVPKIVSLSTVSVSPNLGDGDPLHFLVTRPVCSINKEADVFELLGLCVEAVPVGPTGVIEDDALKSIIKFIKVSTSYFLSNIEWTTGYKTVQSGTLIELSKFEIWKLFLTYLTILHKQQDSKVYKCTLLLPGVCSGPAADT